MWFMSDWQLGKKDYGVENTIKRYDRALQDGVNRIKDLRKLGVQIDEIYMVGLGDLTENCTPHLLRISTTQCFPIILLSNTH